MPLHFRCPCGVVLDSDDGMAGKAGECPDCGKIVIVPQESISVSSEDLKAAGAPEPEPAVIGQAAPAEHAPESWPFEELTEEEPVALAPEHFAPVEPIPVPTPPAEPPVDELVPDIEDVEEVLPDEPMVPPLRAIARTPAPKPSTRIPAAPPSARAPTAKSSTRSSAALPATPRDSEKTPPPPPRSSARVSGRKPKEEVEEDVRKGGPGGSRRMRSGKAKATEKPSMRSRKPAPKKSGGLAKRLFLLLVLLFVLAGGLAAAALFLPEEFLPEALHGPVKEMKQALGLSAESETEAPSSAPAAEGQDAEPAAAPAAEHEPVDVFDNLEAPTSARDTARGIEFAEPEMPDVLIPNANEDALPAPPTPAADIEM